MPDDLAKRILGAQQKRRRDLASRFVYRDKKLGEAAVAAAMSIVRERRLRPGLGQGLEGRSHGIPVRARLFVAGMRQLLQDFKSEFMQEGACRTLPLYMKPPADPVSEVALQHCEVAMLYEIVGSIYGLSTSPHSWYLAFLERVTKIGLVASAMGGCLMPARDADWQLCAILIVHVDDVAFACDPDWEGLGRLWSEFT